MIPQVPWIPQQRRRSVKASAGELKEYDEDYYCTAYQLLCMEADEIMVLDDGKIVGFGKHEDLLASCEAYQEIYYSQMDKEKRAEQHHETGTTRLSDRKI